MRKTLAVLTAALIIGAARGARAQPIPATPPDASAPAAGSVPAASPTGAFASIDKLLADLAAASADMRRFVSGGAANAEEKACVENFNDKKLALTNLPGALQEDVLAYHECHAFVEKNPHACDVLDRYYFKEGVSGMAEHCRAQSVKISAARSIIAQSSDAMARCLDWARNGQLTSAANLPPLCTLIVSRADARTIAPQIAAIMKMSPDQIAGVEAHMGELKGEEKYCRAGGGGGHDAVRAEPCLSIAAYRKAFAAKDESACGAHVICRMMMSDTGACDAVAAKVARSFCAQTGGGTDPVQAFLKKKGDVDVLISQLSQKIQGFQPKNTQRYKTRKDRFVALRDQIQQIEREYHPKGPSKGPSKPR